MGGGLQLKYVIQLCEFIIGMFICIGYLMEYLVVINVIDVIKSLMYVIGIGLVMKGFEGVELVKKLEEMVQVVNLVG